MKLFNWFQKHYGTGVMPILAVIFILGLSIAFGISFHWWIGVSVLAVFVLLFWSQSNTK